MNWKRYTLSPVIRYIKYIFISIQLIIFVSFVVSNNFFLKTKLQEKLNPYQNITLLGQFNYMSKNVSLWIDAWSKVINRNKIVVAAPCHIPELPVCPLRPYPTISPSKYLFYVYDGGQYSPYINIAKVIKEEENIYGILYVHDDLLLHRYILEKIGGNEWIVSGSIEQVITFYENSMIVSNQNLSKILQWLQWNKCSTSFTKMFHDERLQPYRHRTKILYRNGEFIDYLYMNVTMGQSDMLYAVFPNFELKQSFLNLLEVFAEYDLMLECAIPTAVSMMQERFGIKLHNTPLCTHWKELRDMPKEMIENCKREMKHKNIEKYGAYHPIKMGLNNDWMYYFEYIGML